MEGFFMENIQEEINLLEDQITELSKSLNRLKNCVTEKKEEIDVASLEREAQNNKLVNHPMAGCDLELIYRYCVALAAIAELNEDVNTKIKQYYYVLRIYHTLDKTQIVTKLMRDARIASIKDIGFIKENMFSKQLEAFLVDVLLMISGETINEKQLSYFCELVAFCGISKNELTIICSIVKAILEMKMDDLLKLSSKCDINQYISYWGENFEYTVVPKLADVKKTSSDSVMIYGAQILDQNEPIKFDEYGKKKLLFLNCHFDNVLSFESSNTMVSFKNCKIENCKQERKSNSSWRRYENTNETTYFFNCNKVNLFNTTFKNCDLLGFGQNSSLFLFEDAIVEYCSFINCNLGVSIRGGDVSGAVIQSINSAINHCIMINCNAYGEGDYGRFSYAYMRLVQMQGGRITNCKFEKCLVESKRESDETVYNYILLFDERCKESNNEFNECTTRQVWNYGSGKSNEMKVMQNGSK